jgi:hypothetical protein
MARQDDQLTRHFLNLKRRVDGIERELSAQEIPSLIYRGLDEVLVNDDVNLLVKGANVEVIDDFEDGEIGSEYFGDTSAADVSETDPDAFERNFRVCIEPGENDILSLPGDSDTDLENYPESGDIFQAKLYHSEGSITRFGFGVQNQSNYYLITVDTVNNNMFFERVDSGTPTLLDSNDTPVPFSFDAWVDLIIKWGDPIEVSITDSNGNVIETLSASDSTYTTGGIAMGEHSITPAVSTTGSDFVTAQTADFTGDLTALGSATSVDVGFELQPGQSGGYLEGGTLTKNGTGTYEQTYFNLETNTDYNFRARAVSEYGDEVIGSSQSFTTPAREVIDDFEDASAEFTTSSDWGGWTGDTSDWRAQYVDLLEGQYLGELSAAPGEVKSVSTTRDNTVQPIGCGCYFTSANLTGNSGSGFTLSWKDDAGNTAVAIKFAYDGNVYVGNNIPSGSVFAEWSAQKKYLFVTGNIDFGAGTFDAKLINITDGPVTVEKGVDFVEASDNIQEFVFEQDHSGESTGASLEGEIDEPAVET